MKIFVNGVQKEITKTSLNYYDIVMLAHGQPMKRLQTITYAAPAVGDSRRSGEITYTDPAIEMCEGMHISCGFTGNA